MPSGISLHIGLYSVNPNHYAGWDGPLNACEFDAEDMHLIASSLGYQTKKLLTTDATRQAVTDFFDQASKTLKKGDILLVSYSGHGGQLPDKNNDEDDGIDETWCLFDGELVDDELYLFWSKFEEGVRILVISDSCHSGTITKVAKGNTHIYSDKKPRYMNHEVASRTYLKNKDFYDSLLKDIKKVKPEDVKASVKLISGCQDNQVSYDGAFNGQFTGALKRVWNGGSFKGNYTRFHKTIINLMPAYQSPNYYNVGRSNTRFNNQIPFAI